MVIKSRIMIVVGHVALVEEKRTACCPMMRKSE
jgi:hypothetical protein